MKTKLVPEIFVVKKVNIEQEQGKADPFGFDDLTEKIGGLYVPFSGSIKRVWYLVFLPFVNLLIERLNLPGREARIAKTRLEKLFVYFAIQKHLPAGSGIMGISLTGVDPFYPYAGKWLVVDSYKLYGKSVSSLGLDHSDFNKRIERTYLSPRLIRVMNEFWSRQGSLDEHRGWLHRQMPILDKSLFNFERKINSSLLSYISRQISNSEGIKRITDVYSSLMKSPKAAVDKLKQNEGFPFVFLDRFYLECFMALDKEIGGESKGSWEMAYNALRDIRRYHPNELGKSAKVRIWKNAASPHDLKEQLYRAAEKNTPGWFKWEGERICKGEIYPGEYLEGAIAASKAGGANFRLPALVSIVEDISRGGVK